MSNDTKKIGSTSHPGSQKNNSDNNNSNKPLDPTSDAQDFMGDTYGLTGITTDESEDSPNNSSNLKDGNQVGENADTQNDPGSIVGSMSHAKYNASMQISSLKDTDPDSPHPRNQPNHYSSPANDPFNDSSVLKNSDGEHSISGDMPDPESDDDTLENSHMVGLRLNEDEEHPQELDIASDIDAAEEYHKTH